MQDLYSHGTFTGLSTVKRILQRLKTCLFFSLQLWCHFVNTIPSLKEISNFHRKKNCNFTPSRNLHTVGVESSLGLWTYCTAKKYTSRSRSISFSTFSYVITHLRHRTVSRAQLLKRAIKNFQLILECTSSLV